MSESENVKTDGAIAGATKYDTGKSPIYRGAITYFPKAIALVASISNFGATKYAWNGWRHVPDGFGRYSDALVRHLIAEAEGEVVDPDSGLLSIGHTCWNSLARTELFLDELHKSSGQTT